MLGARVKSIKEIKGKGSLTTVQKATNCSLGKATLGLPNEPWNFEQTNSESTLEANRGQRQGIIKHTDWMWPSPQLWSLATLVSLHGGDTVSMDWVIPSPKGDLPKPNFLLFFHYVSGCLIFYSTLDSHSSFSKKIQRSPGYAVWSSYHYKQGSHC